LLLFFMQEDYMPFRKFLLLVAIFVLAMTSFANADPFSALVVYGDSLSDNGNLYSLAAYPPSPPYYMGRFSNGPVSSEQLASILGVPIYDFAVGGATTGIGNYIDGGTQTMAGAHGLPGMQQELAASAPILSPALTSTALFEVWGGANDFLVDGSITTAVANIDSIIATLQADGAKHILVPDMPDLGLTPDFYGDAGATAYAQEFNTLLLASLPSGVTYVDTFDLLRALNSNPTAYGLMNVTDPCLVTTSTSFTVCSNPDQYLFWDGFHPTTTVDTIVAKDFAAAATTPEPSSILLLGTGISGLLILVRKGRHKLGGTT
jgi:phospholipase/lecithinase/hemolysin